MPRMMSSAPSEPCSSNLPPKKRLRPAEQFGFPAPAFLHQFANCKIFRSSQNHAFPARIAPLCLAVRPFGWGFGRHRAESRTGTASSKWVSSEFEREPFRFLDATCCFPNGTRDEPAEAERAHHAR